MQKNTNDLSSAERLLGRVIDAEGAPLDGGSPLAHQLPSAPPAQGGGLAPWETGVKVIDFYAPIARGATVALVASPGVGLVVATAELTQRLAARHGGCMVLTKLDGEAFKLQELAGQLRESGVERETVLIGAHRDDPPARVRRLAEAAVGVAEELRAAGRDVLLVLDDGLALPETADLLRGRAGAGERGSLTLLLCFWRHTGPAPELAPEVEGLLTEADTRLVFSRELGRQGIWPAIDALGSRSRLLTEGAASAEHLRAAEEARALLREGEGAPDQVVRERARKLLLFQAQPFFVAEPFTARPGEHMPLEESVRAFAGIVAGAYDQTPAEELRFIGRAPRPTAT
jgi:F-type H+-transporting ATPase subunit beta